MADTNPAERDPFPRAAGWLLLLAGGGWLALLAWGFVENYFELVPSSDVAMSFWFPIACVSGPFAVVFVAVGAWLVAKG